MALKDVPPMPGDRQDSEGWLSCRNCELRNFGVLGHSHGCQSGSSGGTRVHQNGHVRPGRAHGRAGEVFSDVCFDR